MSRAAEEAGGLTLMVTVSQYTGTHTCTQEAHVTVAASARTLASATARIDLMAVNYSPFEAGLVFFRSNPYFIICCVENTPHDEHCLSAK